MDVPCGDKTGTLTKNQLTLGEPVTFAATGVEDQPKPPSRSDPGN